jgi:hypothetical protein
LESSGSADEYRTFLASFRAGLFAPIYGEYGQRLLEENVRLQDRERWTNYGIHFYAPRTVLCACDVRRLDVVPKRLACAVGAAALHRAEDVSMFYV